MAKFINYRDIDLKINSQEFYASQVSIGASASIEPVILSDGSLLNYSPTNALVGDFNCEFYLTDSLPSFLNVTGTNEDAVSINFAGVEISKAYCKSLSFSVEPFAPILLSVEFDWYGDFNVQDFKEQSVRDRESKSVPNFCAHAFKSYLDSQGIFNTSLGSDGSQGDSGQVGDVVSFSYTSSCDRPSFFNVNELVPFRVAKLNKRCEIGLSASNLGDLISSNGKKASTKIYLKDFYGTVLNEFPVSGVLSNQNYNISQGQYLLSEATIEQVVTERKVLV